MVEVNDRRSIVKDEYVRTGRVVRVVDGDTVDVNIDLGFDIIIKQRVRLARINAPEMTGTDKAKGALSKAYLTKLLEEHPAVTLRTVKTKEKWGRYLAEVEFDGGTDMLPGGQVVNMTYNVSSIMLAEGYAKEYAG